MVLVKTEAGQQVLKDRSVALTPRQRTALILMDGKRSEAEVLAATAAGGITADDIVRLRELGLVAEAPGAKPVAPTAASAAAATAASAVAGIATSPGPGAGAAAAPAGEPAVSSGPVGADRYLEAYRIASRLTSGLGLKGFRLNLAVEAAANFDDLVALAPKIRDAVGMEKFAPLDALIHGH